MTQYNYIYDKLVDSEDDIHGIISYSVYKRQKIQFIKDFESKNNRMPTDQELQPFTDLSTSDAQLEFYKSEATVLTQRFLTNVLAEDLKEREEYFSTRLHTELSGHLESIKPRHLLDIVKGAAGSLLFVMLTGVLYFAVWSLSASPKGVVEQIFDVKIVAAEKAPEK